MHPKKAKIIRHQLYMVVEIQGYPLGRVGRISYCLDGFLRRVGSKKLLTRPMHPVRYTHTLSRYDRPK